MMKVKMIRVIVVLISLLFVSITQTSSVWADPAPFQDGDVFASINNGLVRHYNAAGTLLETLDTGLGAGINTTGCAFDAAGNLYVTTFNAGGVIGFNGPDDPHTSGPFGTGYNGSPESIAFDANGNVYVGAVNGDNDLRKFDPVGILVAQFDVATENRGSDWIDITADQRTLFYTSEGRRILRYDVSGAGAQLLDFATLPGVFPISVAYALRLLPPGDGSGGLLVADNANIKRVDDLGNSVQTYDAPGEDSWFALNLDPDSTSFWSGGLKTGNLYKFDIATGAILLGPIQTGGTLDDKLSGLCVFGEKTVVRQDSDGDGLFDFIEENGYDTVDRNGNPVHVNLQGADRNRKDIYVYIDWLERLLEHNHKPNQDAIDRVVQAFANAPVDCDNAGQNCKGINLHVQFGNLIVETIGANGNQELGTILSGDIYDWREFATLKDSSFPKEFLPVYHYVIFGHSLPGDLTGVSRGYGASDFVIGVGRWEAEPHLPATRTEGWAGIFMHELGHNLGLGHGGVRLSAAGERIRPDFVNHKPNYLSVMNYSFTGPGSPSIGLSKRCRIFFFCDGNMDYSRYGPDILPDLDESRLSENNGLHASDVVKDYLTYYYCPGDEAHRNAQSVEPNKSVDWNCDDAVIISPVGQTADINQDTNIGPLETVNEWPHLVYRGGAIGAFGPPIQLPEQTEVGEEDEFTVERLIENSDRDVLLISLVVDRGTVGPGETVAYTARIASNTGTDLSGIVISNTLPTGFTYQSGSTTGATTSDPVITGQTLVYPGPFTIGTNDILVISFKVTSSNTPGIYLSSTQASGTSAPPVETGNTAPVTVQAPPVGADLSITKTGADIELTWSSDPANDSYEVHRSTAPFFTPAAGTLLTTLPAGSTNYTDPGAAGDPAVNHFYLVRAVAGDLHADSNEVGEIDYALNNNGSQYSLIALPFPSTTINNAATLASAIGDVSTMLKWNQTTQVFRIYNPPTNTGDNFPVSTGDVVFVVVNSGGPNVFSQVGNVTAVQYTLQPNGYNFIALPLQRAGLTNASGVATDITHVTAMLAWNSATQVFRIYNPPTNTGDNFAVQPGAPFIIQLDASGPPLWP